MKLHVLKVYFKAAVLVPFYLACFMCFMGIGSVWLLADYHWQAIAESPFCQGLLEVTVLSGVTGMLTLTAFLNLLQPIAQSLLYSLLAWMLLPYSFISYLFWQQVDWRVMNRPGSAEMIREIFLLIICFFHVIGIIISYTDFRATMVLNKKELAAQKANNDNKTGSGL